MKTILLEEVVFTFGQKSLLKDFGKLLTDAIFAVCTAATQSLTPPPLFITHLVEDFAERLCMLFKVLFCCNIYSLLWFLWWILSFVQQKNYIDAPPQHTNTLPPTIPHLFICSIITPVVSWTHGLNLLSGGTEKHDIITIFSYGVLCYCNMLSLTIHIALRSLRSEDELSTAGHGFIRVSCKFEVCIWKVY